MRDDQKWEIIQGDALRVLSGFAPNSQKVFQYGGERTASL